MRRIIPAFLLLFFAGTSILRGEPAVTTEDLSGACSLREEALSHKVAETLSRNPRSIAAVARLARGCSCEQATSMARGLVRAIKALQQDSPEAVEPMFGALNEACSCRADDAGLPNKAIAGQRCESERRWRQTDALNVRPTRSGDCFCAAAASLAAQAFAGDAQRFGFFPDEGAFNGGGVGPGFGSFAPAQSVTSN